MEIDAQTATLEEQRNHIAVLDKALSNAQDRLGKSNRVGAEFLEKNRRYRPFPGLRRADPHVGECQNPTATIT